MEHTPRLRALVAATAVALAAPLTLAAAGPATAGPAAAGPLVPAAGPLVPAAGPLVPAATVLAARPATTAFTDVPDGAPFAAEIERLASDGVMTGYPDGTFRPQAAVTRDALAAFLYRLVVRASYRPPSTPLFADVPLDHPFYTEISWLAQQGVSTGWQLPDGRRVFRPSATVTREALATFLHRLAGQPEAPTAATGFADVPASHPFHDAIAWLAGAGISTGWDLGGGVVVFRPGVGIERQAMAAFLVRFDDLRLCLGAPGSAAGSGGSEAPGQAAQPGGPPGLGGQLPPGQGGDVPPGHGDESPGTRTSLSC